MCGLKTTWVKDGSDYHYFAYSIMRDSEDWKNLYCKRSTAERVFSRLKETRRLEKHCFREFDMLNIHSTLSVLVMQAVASAKVKTGKTNDLRECVRQVG